MSGGGFSGNVLVVVLAIFVASAAIGAAFAGVHGYHLVGSGHKVAGCLYITIASLLFIPLLISIWSVVRDSFVSLSRRKP